MPSRSYRRRGHAAGTGFDARVGPQPCSVTPEAVRSRPPTERSAARGPPWEEHTRRDVRNHRLAGGARREGRDAPRRERRDAGGETPGASDARREGRDAGDETRCRLDLARPAAASTSRAAGQLDLAGGRPARPRGRPASSGPSCGIARGVNTLRADPKFRGHAGRGGTARPGILLLVNPAAPRMRGCSNARAIAGCHVSSSPSRDPPRPPSDPPLSLPPGSGVAGRGSTRRRSRPDDRANGRRGRVPLRGSAGIGGRLAEAPGRAVAKAKAASRSCRRWRDVRSRDGRGRCARDPGDGRSTSTTRRGWTWRRRGTLPRASRSAIGRGPA